jgi:hypothetical protein
MRDSILVGEVIHIFLSGVRMVRKRTEHIFMSPYYH